MAERTRVKNEMHTNELGYKESQRNVTVQLFNNSVRFSTYIFGNIRTLYC